MNAQTAINKAIIISTIRILQQGIKTFSFTKIIKLIDIYYIIIYKKIVGL